VFVKLTTDASDLRRACARLSTELAQLPENTDELFTSISRERIGNQYRRYLNYTPGGSPGYRNDIHSIHGARRRAPYPALRQEHSRNWLLTWEDARGYDRLSQPRDLLTGTRANERDPDSLNSSFNQLNGMSALRLFR
jgi:hypothetical protein